VADWFINKYAVFHVVPPLNACITKWIWLPSYILMVNVGIYHFKFYIYWSYC